MTEALAVLLNGCNYVLMISMHYATVLFVHDGTSFSTIVLRGTRGLLNLRVLPGFEDC